MFATVLIYGVECVWGVRVFFNVCLGFFWGGWGAGSVGSLVLFVVVFKYSGVKCSVKWSCGGSC